MTAWSLRRRITLTFAGTALLAVLGSVIGIVAFDRLLDARHDVVEELDPASVTLRDLLAAMLDQETGVRGFALTGDETFLTPYTQGRQNADAAIRQLDASSAIPASCTSCTTTSRRQPTRGTATTPSPSSSGCA